MVVVESFTKQSSYDGMRHIYIYRLLKDEMLLYVQDQGKRVQTYGIEIERQDLEDGRMIKIERECVKNISPQRQKIHDLMQFLYNKEVSPIHLIDIIGEYVDNCVNDFEESLCASCNC